MLQLNDLSLFSDDSNWWFFTDAAKHRVEVNELTVVYPDAHVINGFDVNSIDICNSMLICGTDNAAVCAFYEINLC